MNAERVSSFIRPDLPLMLLMCPGKFRKQKFFTIIMANNDGSAEEGERIKKKNEKFSREWRNFFFCSD
jgi:hypothetical protein